MKHSIATLKPLVERLKQAKSALEKIEILEGGEYPSKILKTYALGLQPECLVIIKSLLAIDQGEVVFNGLEQLNEPFERLRQLVKSLIPVEKFYEPIGGIVGYHTAVLQLIVQKQIEQEVRYHKPEEIDISKDTPQLVAYIREGLAALPKMAEIYPVGGAGDRLDLRDEASGEPLPAAELLFGGKTLLEGLIRDLEAREWLYERLYDQKLVTPIVLMTSHEKDNHRRIEEICAKNRWFGRPKESFFVITQPLVPVIAADGSWVMRGPLQPMTKPGGHGALWKLAIDSGAVDWLHGQKRHHALIRQINNPIAGTDGSLLAFAGVGMAEKKAFGFASCSRLLNTAEGMVVLVEQEGRYHIGNIEYTDFAKHGIQDEPEHPGSPYSAFPANTNILFADLDVVEKAAQKNPIPGMLINMKTKAAGCDQPSGRLESLMQAVADEIVDPDPKHLRTFLTCNTREKTISVTKQAYQPGKTAVGTPEGAFYDLLLNARDLLKKCRMEAPDLPSLEEFLAKGPSFLFLYHPALGPLYSIIAQKIRGGELMPGAELQLDLAEALLEDCRIEGSLLVAAESFQKGRCLLRNVSVLNRGVDPAGQHCYWKNRIKRQEALEIRLLGESEFIAEEISFEGPFRIEVPHGHRTVAYSKNDKVHFRTEKIALPSWRWSYAFDSGNRIQLHLAAPILA